MFTKNEFVRWYGNDEDGRFSHEGQVVSSDENIIVFRNNTGTFGIPSDEGKWTRIKKPAKWSLNTQRPTKAKKAIIPQPGNKYQTIITLLSEHKPGSRKEALGLIADAEIMTPAGASTYVAKANKELKLW